MLYHLKNRNFWVMLLVDLSLLAFVYHFAYYLRFDGDIPAREFRNFLNTIVWVLPIKIFCFILFQLYKGMWRYTGLHDLGNLLKACVLSSAIIALILLLSVRFVGYARSVFIIDFFLTFLFIGGYRLGIRLYFAGKEGHKGLGWPSRPQSPVKRVLIIGAGDAGELLIREMRENRRLVYDVVGLIDDDRSKLHKTIHGIPVLGGLNDLGTIAKRNLIDEMIIAIPSATALQMRHIVSFCEESGIPYKTIPGMGELIQGRVSVNFAREVRYEDLLGRRPVLLNLEQIGAYLTGRNVMVTGGAGSIGSELCRQMGPFKPGKLLVMDRSESGLYEIEMEMHARFPHLKARFVLGAIQNTPLMERFFDEEKPEVVFHAAAYKHVPMMELHPWEAVFNNVIGSMVLLDLCHRKAVGRTVIVSTDKAVRPTNVMGASKRLVELLCQAYAHKGPGRFMAVRFGNVVGSAGSVIPLFRAQILRGGPVTVTHPEVTRYFMTIPEASRLILQAGALGLGGEIFILEMGTPIRIQDMARDVIRLSGFTPGKDIAIEFVGLRPGEKLHEELITRGEDIVKTGHEGIMVLNTENSVSLRDVRNGIRKLETLARAADSKGIKKELQQLIPEYQPEPPG